MLTRILSRLRIVRLVVAYIAFTLTICTFCAHAILLLSEVLVVYFQAAILLLTATSATFMFMASTQMDNAGLQLILVCISVLSGGLSVLAFIIAVAMWRAMVLRKKEIIARYNLE